MIRALVHALLISTALCAPALHKRVNLKFSWHNGSVPEGQEDEAASLLRDVIEPAVRNAFVGAKEMAAVASTVPRSSPLFKRYFGPVNDTEYTFLGEHFRRIAEMDDMQSDLPVFMYTADDPSNTGKYLAWVAGHDDVLYESLNIPWTDLNFYPGFSELPALRTLQVPSPETSVLGMNYYTREDLILHELHHLDYLVRDPSGEQIGDHAYGDEACIEIAKTSAFLTWHNADSYTFFALWAYLTRDHHLVASNLAQHPMDGSHERS